MRALLEAHRPRLRSDLDLYGESLQSLHALGQESSGMVETALHWGADPLQPTFNGQTPREALEAGVSAGPRFHVVDPAERALSIGLLERESASNVIGNGWAPAAGCGG